MNPRVAELARWHGPLDRGAYFVTGAVLLVVKYGIDWLVASVFFQRSWTVLNYLVLPEQAVRLFEVSEPDRLFYGTLLLLALPFIGVGTVLTLRRLHSAGLPVWLVVLFFVPVINLFLFLTLSLLRSRESPRNAALARPHWPEAADDHVRPAGEPSQVAPEDVADFHFVERERLIAAIHRQVVPERPGADLAFALLLSVPLALLFVVFAILSLHSYGWGLFVGMPFFLGMGSALLYGLRRPKTAGQCMGVASLALLLLFVGLVVVAFEGVICLLMAAPLAWVLTIMGAGLGYLIQELPWHRHDVPGLWLALTALLPALMAAECADLPEAELIEVTSSIDIDAPPERVWESVIAFPPLAEPDEWLFRAGVAYPVRAELQGQGVGAIRRCVFSTGTFVEPITAWEPPHRLAFDVVEQPAPMVEWSPYEIHPPHLDHYLVSRRGEFRLIALPGGRTRLQGTTWYTNKMWPAAYWQLWSDHVIHQIHQRVLRHIQTTVEER